jgi:hypothetical protein
MTRKHWKYHLKKEILDIKISRRHSLCWNGYHDVGFGKSFPEWGCTRNFETGSKSYAYYTKYYAIHQIVEKVNYEHSLGSIEHLVNSTKSLTGSTPSNVH